MLSRYRFRPGWVTTLAALLLVPVLVGLGLWQLDRAREKIEIRDHYRARSRMAPIDVNRSVLDPAAAEFRRAAAKGRYREDLTVYLDNKVMNGVPGYDILTPLELVEPGGAGTDRFILVNRGWISWGGSRRALPSIETPGGVVAVTGRLKVPPEDYFTLEDRSSDSEFKPLWQNLDLARFRKVTGLQVSPLVLQLDPADSRGGGFVRQWPRFSDPWIERHRAYAVQWFAMAFIVVVLYLVLNLERRSPNSG